MGLEGGRHMALEVGRAWEYKSWKSVWSAVFCQGAARGGSLEDLGKTKEKRVKQRIG
jgi:hypothetical protein